MSIIEGWDSKYGGDSKEEIAIIPGKITVGLNWVTRYKRVSKLFIYHHESIHSHGKPFANLDFLCHLV